MIIIIIIYTKLITMVIRGFTHISSKLFINDKYFNKLFLFKLYCILCDLISMSI